MKDAMDVMQWRGGAWVPGTPPPPPEETPVAIVIDGMSQAVLMATPHDLQDFATGFALTEGMIADPADITGFETVPVETRGLPGVEARLWLRPGLSALLLERRRSMIGPVGCGLCGVDSIEAALPQITPVAGSFTMPPEDVARAMAAMSQGQARRRDTPAIHGAGFWDGSRAIVREDVGRHNAVDKVIGWALLAERLPLRACFLLVSSRASFEITQKAYMAGIPLLACVSAASSLAVETAEEFGMTLVGFTRAAEDGDGRMNLYTHPERIDLDAVEG